MGRSQETFNKKEVRNKKEKKRKEKEKKRLARKENEKSGDMDDMIAYVDENGMLTSTPPDPDKKKKVKLEDIEIGVPTRAEEEEMDPIRKGTVHFLMTQKDLVSSEIRKPRKAFSCMQTTSWKKLKRATSSALK